MGNSARGYGSGPPGENPNGYVQISMDGSLEVNEFRIAGGPQAPLSARECVSETFATQLDKPVVDNMRLLVSELVTNCVLHGGADTAAEITVRAAVHHDRVRTEVCHDSPAFEPPVGKPDLDSPGGLGLFLVEQMSSAWGIHDNSENCVWFELGLAA